MHMRQRQCRRLIDSEAEKSCSRCSHVSQARHEGLGKTPRSKVGRSFRRRWGQETGSKQKSRVATGPSRLGRVVRPHSRPQANGRVGDSIVSQPTPPTALNSKPGLLTPGLGPPKPTSNLLESASRKLKKRAPLSLPVGSLCRPSPCPSPPLPAPPLAPLLVQVRVAWKQKTPAAGHFAQPPLKRRQFDYEATYPRGCSLPHRPVHISSPSLPLSPLRSPRSASAFPRPVVIIQHERDP